MWSKVLWSKLLFLSLTASLTAGADALKVAVLGASGFVGQRALRLLAHNDAVTHITALSRNGEPKAASSLARVEWKANDLTRGARETLADAIGQPDVVISCVGAVGFDVQGLLLGNGIANAEAARASAAAGVKRYVFVSVASEVADAKGWLPKFFGGYFAGKEQACDAIVEAVGRENAHFIKPTFIYGGDGFGLFPPRVSEWYGAGIEELLSTKPVRALAGVMPGLIKVALRPPVSVDAVAAACVNAALGEIEATDIDGTDAINNAAGVKTPTTIADAIEDLKEKVAA